MPYLLGLGHDVDLEDLLPLDPQPATVGYLFGRRSYAASGAVIDELPHVEYLYSALEDAEMYQSLLSQTGLLVATTALVTVYVQDENYEWSLFNGRIVKPLIGTDGQRSNFWLNGFTFLVHSLRAII